MRTRDLFRRRLEDARRRELESRAGEPPPDHRRASLMAPIVKAALEIQKELKHADYLVWKLLDDLVGVQAPHHGDRIEISVGLYESGKSYYRVLTNTRDDTYRGPQEAIDRFMDELSDMIAAIELVKGDE
ncbi:MAG: hypothetical protein OEQ29_06530 [Alphaproteobacteria bacterium]|nr:hypothetical protein [Alphaproteobacteria bacterium]